MKRDFNEWLSKFKTSISDYKYYVDFDKIYKNITYMKKEYEINNVFKKEEFFKEIDFKNIYSLDKVISNKINTYKAKP